MRLRRHRPLAFVGVAAIALGLAAVTLHYWYFREVDHQWVNSPDGQWVVVVSKRMDQFPEPVEVRLKVVENRGSAREVINIHFDSPDCWQDVKTGSYRVEWVSDVEFRVGGREPNEEWETRGRFVGDKWVLEPAGW